MSSNLGYYYKILQQLEQWQPGERITRLRNMALLILGLHMGGSVHLSLIVRSWPIAGKLPSLVNRLRRFINNERLEVKGWYHPIAEHLVRSFAGKQVRLVIDCTKIGFAFRLMTIGLAYKKRTLPLVWSVHKGPKGHTSVADGYAK